MIDKMIDEALLHAKAKHGEEFNSVHEKYAVLKNEIEEAEYEISSLNFEFYIQYIWDKVKDKEILDDDLFLKMENNIKRAIEELAQVIAVCKKHVKR